MVQQHSSHTTSSAQDGPAMDISPQPLLRRHTSYFRHRHIIASQGHVSAPFSWKQKFLSSIFLTFTRYSRTAQGPASTTTTPPGTLGVPLLLISLTCCGRPVAMQYRGTPGFRPLACTHQSQNLSAQVHRCCPPRHDLWPLMESCTPGSQADASTPGLRWDCLVTYDIEASYRKQTDGRAPVGGGG